MTRILMNASALFMAVLGVAASFAPQEILIHFDVRPEGSAVLLMQITGALYLGFAMLDWMARGNLIGGIYSRPVAIGNFTHFAVVSVVLMKVLIAGQKAPHIVAGAAAYAALAVGFGLVLFTHPAQDRKRER
jgi:hypothetical protein